ncbi:MAG: FAD-dependent oxidoreductase [Phycisphaeraceae bacterium]
MSHASSHGQGDGHADILIVGGGTGGCAAAMAATSLGYRVVMTEPTRWIGGQLTSQAVPPDESPWIERCGCTRRYRQFRDGVRDFYRQHYPLTEQARLDPHLNPGQGHVSRLCHEPRIAWLVIENMLHWAQASGLLDLRLQRRPVAVDVEGDRIRSVTVEHTPTGRRETITARYVLDATELGDLLSLARVEYVSGAESQDDFAEPHAVAGPAQPDNVQAITWCFPMAYDPTPGADHRRDKPAQYDFWRQYVPQLIPPWTGPLLDWTQSHPKTFEPLTRVLFLKDTPRESRSLWFYRRILARQHLQPDAPAHEATLVNWPQNDYWLGNIIDKPDAQVAQHLASARELSFCLFHWLQNDAPRPDGGAGYPGLYLRPDMVGSDDGLAQAPYTRESRRIRALFTVTEHHVSMQARRAAGLDHAEPFADSVGIGSYGIDLHPSTTGCNYIDIPSLPFQIPLGSLVPVRMRNLLPAAKNLGVTHIANGCYRLHPVEWNIGESAGLLAAFCLQQQATPQDVSRQPKLTESFQALLLKQGIELEWPADIWHAP